jgi:hypothetical protein
VPDITFLLYACQQAEETVSHVLAGCDIRPAYSSTEPLADLLQRLEDGAEARPLLW